MRATLLDTLEDFSRRGGECAYIYPRGYRRERWSYARIASTAYRLARELQKRGIKKNNAALLWAPNSAEWIAAFLGCAVAGVVVVPIDDGAGSDFAARVASEVDAKIALCSSRRAATLKGLDSLDVTALCEAVAHHPASPFRPVAIEGPDTLEIIFTSGTTAEPKGVVISHANVVGNLLPIETEIAKYRKYEWLVHPLRFLNLLPLSHVFGQFLGIFIPPLLGATVVFEHSLNPAEVIRTVRREHVSVLVAVPRMLESLKQKLERDLSDAGHGTELLRRYEQASRQRFLRRWWTFRDIHRRFGWKFWAVISGGASLDPQTEHFWQQIGYAVIQGYGLTETTSLISVNHPFHVNQGSIGKVLPGREIRLAADGEILVRGQGVAGGYWAGKKFQPMLSEEHWFHTGDLGSLDAEGNLFFKGRKKEVIVTPAGMNVYPADIETALRAQPEVRDCVVVGVDLGGNAEPCAVILTAPGAMAAELIANANQSLAEYQKIRHWLVWPEPDFPRTSTQKPRRNLIHEFVQQRFAQDQASEIVPSSKTSASPLSDLLTRIAGRRVSSLSGNTNLESGLGLTSLERVELLGALEDRYQIDLSETSFADATTVGDLEKLLRSSGTSTREFHYPRWTLRWPVTWLRVLAQYLLVRPAVFLLGSPRVIGRENLAGVRGPLLVISNHIDDVDVGFIQTALPARFPHKIATATGGEALEALRSPGAGRPLLLRAFDRIQWSLGVALLNLFPLPRESGFRKSFAYAGEAVDRGYSVLIFPEGRHTEDGKLGPFRTGIGLLARNLSIPVLPMRIDGLFELKRRGRKLAPPGAITVRIGKPVSIPPLTAPEQIAQELQGEVERL